MIISLCSLLVFVIFFLEFADLIVVILLLLNFYFMAA